jgi:hypothetical protein
VAASKIVVQTDRVSALVEPVAQIDVLDARTWKALVEPADRPEGTRTDRPQARPERCRDRAGGAVHECVRQILVLRYEVRRPRDIVVGAEHRLDARLDPEALDNARQSVGRDDHVGVDEHQHFTVGDRRATVPRDGGT